MVRLDITRLLPWWVALPLEHSSAGVTTNSTGVLHESTESLGEVAVGARSAAVAGGNWLRLRVKLLSTECRWHGLSEPSRRRVKTDPVSPLEF